MNIPPVLLRFVATIEPYIGAGSTGPRFGPAFTVRCFAEAKRQLVQSREGRKVVATATIWLPVGTTCPTESKVTVRTPGGLLVAGEGRVLTSTPRLGGGLPTPDHLEITIS